MGKAGLTMAEATAMFCHVADCITAQTDVLTQADKAIGDGDHGIGMARGFDAVRQKLAAQPPGSIAELLRTVGAEIMTASGGASGAIFGTLFRGGARNAGDASVFDAEILASFLNDGLKAVQERGHAQVGDKTMVDALAPAAAQARDLSAEPLDQALAGAAAAARQGMEATKHMVAATGKARTLGERSLGHVDPGAVTMTLILQAMAEYCC